MRIRLNSLQEKAINEEEQTLGKTLLVTHEELARLKTKNLFKTNIPRLHRRLKDKAIIGLRDLNQIVAFLPDSYKKKILKSDAWFLFSERMNRESRSLKEFEDIDVVVGRVYSSLTDEMQYIPPELRPSVLARMEPLLILLEGIFDTMNRMQGKSPVKVRVPPLLRAS